MTLMLSAWLARCPPQGNGRLACSRHRANSHLICSHHQANSRTCQPDYKTNYTADYSQDCLDKTHDIFLLLRSFNLSISIYAAGNNKLQLPPKVIDIQ
jgi:hypothetical protein